MKIFYETHLTNPSKRVMEISEAFGVGVDETHKHVILDDVEIPKDFNVLYITGMSGSGKSSTLRRLMEEYNYQEIEEDFDDKTPIIDLIGDTLDNGLYYLNIVGLGEAHLYIKPYNCLSQGQKYRFKLAKLLERKQEIIFVDEFCSFLDRTTAFIVSYNLQKIVRKLNVKLVVATAHNDLKDYLLPDYILDFKNGENVALEENIISDTNPFLKDITIEEGTIKDFNVLEKYHYVGNRPAYIKKVYKMNYKGGLIGVVVYCCPKPNIGGRNVYFGKKYLNKGVPLFKEINRDFISLSRIVIHPMFRGVGLGEILANTTAPMTNTKYVEVMSVMTKYNKFLKGDFVLVGEDLSQVTQNKREKVVKLLEKYGFTYDMIISEDYCQKILETIPQDELKNVCYIVLSSGFNRDKNGVLKKIPEISFKTKKEFMENITLTPKMLKLCRFPITEYYLYTNNNLIEE